MKTEELIEYVNNLIEYVNNDENFIQVDPFAEYLSGVTDDELYVLLTGLEIVQDMDDIWLVGISRTKELVEIAVSEFNDRDLANSGYLLELTGRGIQATRG